MPGATIATSPIPLRARDSYSHRQVSSAWVGRGGCQAGNSALPHARLCLPHPAECLRLFISFGDGCLVPLPLSPPCPHHTLPKLPNQISPCTRARLAWRPAADGNEARLRISHRLSDAGTYLGVGVGRGRSLQLAQDSACQRSWASQSCLGGGPLRTSDWVPGVSVRPAAASC